VKKRLLVARISPALWYWIAIFCVLIALNGLRLPDTATLFILLGATAGSLWFTWQQWSGNFINFGSSSKKYVYWRGQRFEMEKPKQRFTMPSLRSLGPVGLYVFVSLLFLIATLAKFFALLQL
jgi:hypothetical protein